MLNLRFPRLLLLVPFACSSAFALPGPAAHKGVPIPDIVQNVFSSDLLGDIIKGIGLNPSINAAFPGLRSALKKVKADDITSEEYCRALLSAIQDHDVYKTEYDSLEPDQQENVKRFLKGEASADIMQKRSDFYLPPSPAVKHHLKRMEETGETVISRAWLNAKKGESPVIYGDHSRTKVVKVRLRGYAKTGNEKTN